MKPTLISKLLLTALTSGALALSLLPAAAQADQPYDRVHDQRARIDQGVASGQLTWREYRSVESHLDAINAQRRYDLARNGDHLTPGERAQLNRELNRNSGRIYFDKHNRADQPGV